MPFILDIITPDRTVFTGHVLSVTLPTPSGEITVLPHHISLVTVVEPGSLIARDERGEHLFAVSRGTIEVDTSGIRVLVRSADSGDDLVDEAAIEKAKKDAETLMREKHTDAEAFAEATAVLDREIARLRSVRRRHSRAPSRRIEQ